MSAIPPIPPISPYLIQPEAQQEANPLQSAVSNHVSPANDDLTDDQRSEIIAEQCRLLECEGLTPEISILTRGGLIINVNCMERLRKEDVTLLQSLGSSTRGKNDTRVVCISNSEESRSVDAFADGRDQATWARVQDHIDEMRTMWFGGKGAAYKYLEGVDLDKKEDSKTKEFLKDIICLCELLDEAVLAGSSTKAYVKWLSQGNNQNAMCDFTKPTWELFIQQRLRRFREGSPLLGSFCNPNFREKELGDFANSHGQDKMITCFFHSPKKINGIPDNPTRDRLIRRHVKKTFTKEKEEAYQAPEILADLTREHFKLGQGETFSSVSLRLVRLTKILSNAIPGLTISSLTPEQRSMSFEQATKFVKDSRRADEAASALLAMEDKKDKKKKAPVSKDKEKAFPDKGRQAQPKSAKAVASQAEPDSSPLPEDALRKALGELSSHHLPKTFTLHGRVSRWLNGKDLPRIRKDSGYKSLTDQDWTQAVIDHNFPRIQEFLAHPALCERFTFKDFYLKSGSKKEEKIPYTGIVAIQVIKSGSEEASASSEEAEQRHGILSLAADRTNTIYHAYFTEGLPWALKLETPPNIKKDDDEEEPFELVGRASFEPNEIGDIIYTILAPVEGKRVYYIFKKLYQ